VRDWSNATQWPGGVLPSAGMDVLVERPWRLRLDVEPNRIRHLVVEGELFFDERRAETTLQVPTPTRNPQPVANTRLGANGRTPRGSSRATQHGAHPIRSERCSKIRHFLTRGATPSVALSDTHALSLGASHLLTCGTKIRERFMCIQAGNRLRLF
jgi:hypothetical protein